MSSTAILILVEMLAENGRATRPQYMRLMAPTYVTLMGKGRKERISPIWPETAELLAALLRRHPRRSDETVFVNRYGELLTASGFRFRLHQYVKAAA